MEGTHAFECVRKQKTDALLQVAIMKPVMDGHLRIIAPKHQDICAGGADVRPNLRQQIVLRAQRKGTSRPNHTILRFIDLRVLKATIV